MSFIKPGSTNGNSSTEIPSLQLSHYLSPALSEHVSSSSRFLADVQQGRFDNIGSYKKKRPVARTPGFIMPQLQRFGLQ